jgi:hypothetical protein
VLPANSDLVDKVEGQRIAVFITNHRQVESIQADFQKKTEYKEILGYTMP